MTRTNRALAPALPLFRIIQIDYLASIGVILTVVIASFCARAIPPGLVLHGR
jgi:hypothetical protein